MRLALLLALALPGVALAQESPVLNAAAIAPFLRQLPPAPGASLSIVQVGDSHTAGDALTHGWRAAWQAEYGGAGRGMLPVGRPYDGYLPHGVTARQSADWVANARFGKGYHAIAPALGLAGFTQTATHAGASLSLSADSADYRFDQFALCGLTGPDKGAVAVGFGSGAQRIDFAAPAPGAACFTIDSAETVGLVTVTTLDDRPVSLTAWSTGRKAGGITLSNLGVVGSRLAHLARDDEAVVTQELALARPDLLVIAFGTNEGFDPALHLDETEAAFRREVARLRRLMITATGGQAPILLLGPPDAASNRPDVAQPGNPETVACGGGWYVPAHLAQMRALEMRLAQDLGLAFWDWQGAMGGACSSTAWVAQGLQRGDHVHFTTEGGRRLGAMLAHALDAARATPGG